MSDKQRRKALAARARENPPACGVYRIVNETSGKALLASATNLDSARNKLAFAKSTKTASALDYRLRPDIARDGLERFSFEILEELEVTEEMSDRQIAADLAALLELWREKLSGAALY